MTEEFLSDRRTLLQRLAVGGLAGYAGQWGIAGAAAAVPASSPHDLTAVEAIAAMRRGELRAEVYARALLAREEQLRTLNAFASIDPDATLEAARAADVRRNSGKPLPPLHGLPLAVKDSINTRMLPTASGTRALRDFRPAADAPIMTRLFAGGAMLMGKTNLHELSYGYTSNNPITGAVRNPHDPSRIPGGSSGGSGVAVAARITPIAMGEDTFGSIRVPSSLCGICGLRPSIGRYPVGGLMPASSRFDMTGPMARNVADLALVDAIASGEPPALQARPLDGVRIAVAPAYFLAELDPEIERLTHAALQRLRAAGAVLVWADLPQVMDGAMMDGLIATAEDTVAEVSRYLEEHATGISFRDLYTGFSPALRELFDTWILPDGKDRPPREEIAAAIQRLPNYRTVMSEYFRKHQVDAIAFPPVPMPAPPIGLEDEVEIRGSKVPLWMAMAHNVAAGSTAGLPGLVLPAGLTTGGLPIGLEFDGPPESDRHLLALGLSLEKALGTIPSPRLNR